MPGSRCLRILFSAAFVVMLFTGCTQRTSDTQMRTQSGFYFDTVITIQADATQEVMNAAFDMCRVYEEMLSKTVTASDVWNINHAAGKSVQVSAETMEVLLFAQKMAADTGGAFDITIAPVVALWNFTGDNSQVPPECDLQKAVSAVGYQHLKTDAQTLTVTAEAGTEIDLGGIAKGFIADKIGAFLTANGVRTGFLNFGGNVLLIGEKTDGSTWKVGVQDPNAQPGEYTGVISCAGNSSVVTSGTYERFFIADGVRYHHILDPKTGYPVQNTLAGVTIFARSSLMADAYSTACFVLGPEAGLSLAEQNPEVEALFMYESGELLMTEGMKALYTER